MKKLLAILLGACLLLGVMTGCGGNAEDAVTVQKVSDITSQGSVGLVNRYAGIVVSGETATVKKPAGRKAVQQVTETGKQKGQRIFCHRSCPFRYPSDSVSGAESGAQNLVDLLGIGLTLGGLHCLTDQSVKGLLLTGAEFLHHLGIGGKHFVDNAFNRGSV